MRRIKALRALAGAVVMGMALSVAPAVGQAQTQTVGFSPLGYSGTCGDGSPLWGGDGLNIVNHEGFDFIGLRPLDIGHYQNVCWMNRQQNGYANGTGNLADVVALGFGPASVQRVNPNTRFTLQSMILGAGWSDATVTVSGFTGERGSASAVAMFTKSLAVSPGSLNAFDFGSFGSIGINFFSIDVSDWGTSQYNAHWLSNVPIDDRTYFVSSMQVGTVAVPEPASVALLAAGLLGLGAAARRRRGAARS